MRQHLHRQGTTLLETLVVFTIIAILMSLLLPALHQAQSAADRMVCASHLQQHGIAFHSRTDILPRGSKRAPIVLPRLSWRLDLLPSLEQEELMDRFLPQEDWDGPNNAALIDKMPKIMGCPDSWRNREGIGAYEGIMELAASPVPTPQIPATEAKVILVELNDAVGRSWTRPLSNTEQFQLFFGTAPTEKLPPAKVENFVGHHGSVFHVLFADGRVEAVSSLIDPKKMTLLLTGVDPAQVDGLLTP